MIVSVLSTPSALPAFSIASCSFDNGLPCASVRESIPTSRMSTAPSIGGPSSSAPAITSIVTTSSAKFVSCDQ